MGDSQKGEDPNLVHKFVYRVTARVRGTSHHRADTPSHGRAGEDVLPTGVGVISSNS